MEVDRKTGTIFLNNAANMNFNEFVRTGANGKTVNMVELWPNHSTHAESGFEYTADELVEYARALLELAEELRGGHG